MRCSIIICIFLVCAVLEIRSDLSGLYSLTEPCVKELELNIADYAKLIDKADDDGDIDLDDIQDLRKAPEGACILKCMLVKKGYFKPTGEINITKENEAKLAKIDVNLCKQIKKADLCEEVVETCFCLAKQFAAKTA